MANITVIGGNGAAAEDTDAVHTELKHPLGTRAVNGGDEYIYLQGVASTVAGDWVTFDEAHLTTRAVANGKGRVAVAMAAVVASSYGWYQIYGKNTVAKALTGFADDAQIYLTATAGSIDDAVVAGDFVVGAMGRSAVSGGVITAELNYPIVHDSAI